MQNQAPSNVVKLEKSSNPSRRLVKESDSKLLAGCHQLILERLGRAIPGMMDQVDDSLFELAEKADTNRTQAHYFEAMREVRLKRTAMEDLYREKLATSFEEKMSRSRNSHPDFQLPDQHEFNLGLVDNEDLEESLAVTNMVAKIKMRCKEELFGFDTRVGQLLNNPNLSEDDNPLGPKTVCDAFKNACDRIQAGIEVKLIVLKLFDKHVVSEAADIYTELNAYLIKHGVLPKLPTTIKKRPAKRPNSQLRADPRTTEPATRGERGFFEPIPDNQRVAGGGPNWDGSGPSSDSSGNSRMAGTRVGLEQLIHQLTYGVEIYRDDFDTTYDRFSGEDVLRSLTSLQQGGESGIGDIDSALVASGTVNVLPRIKSSSVATSLSHVDNIMIDVVSMMFDFILEDREIAPVMKALIGRLQIPILKVAILDKQFFSSRTHPARVLLNKLGEAALQASTSASDELHDVVERSVEHILNGFTDELGVFDTALQMLEQTLSNEAEQAADQTADYAKALLKAEQLKQAGVRAHDEIEKRLAKPKVAPFVREFLAGYWKELLCLAYMKEGEVGDGWRAGLDTMDDLLWSVAPKPIAEDRARLSSLLPRLLEKLRTGTAQIAMTHAEQERFLSRLAKVHISIVTPGAEPETARPASSPMGEAERTVAEIQAPPSVKTLNDDLIRRAVELANDAVYRTAESRAQCKGMGTTTVAAELTGDQLTLAHVGDSRAYRLTNDTLAPLTKDHSLRQDVIDKGYFTAEEAAEKVPGHILSRAVGVEEKLEVEVQAFRTCPGDIFLFCSDGLTDLVDDNVIERSLTKHDADLKNSAHALVTLANEAGGLDNISVMLARIPDPALDNEDKLEIVGVTDVGRQRSHNEDFIGADRKHGLVVLADGMGGCKAGEVASRMTTSIILRCLGTGEIEAVRRKMTNDGTNIDIDTLFAEFVEHEGTDFGDYSVEVTDMLGSLTDDIEDPFDFSSDPSNIEEIEITDGLGVGNDAEPLDASSEAVKRLRVGSWLEFDKPDATRIRARLSWISPVTSTLLFTDSKGLKVADPTRLGLAAELRSERARVLESVPLFDRLLGQLSGKVRNRTIEGYDEHTSV